MEENWYAVQQQAHDRITEARAIARSQALTRDAAPSHRARFALGMALIRLGGWVLGSGVTLANEFSRALATLRAVTDRALRV